MEQAKLSVVKASDKSFKAKEGNLVVMFAVPLKKKIEESFKEDSAKVFNSVAVKCREVNDLMLKLNNIRLGLVGYQTFDLSVAADFYKDL